MTLREFFQQVYQPRRLLGRSPETVRLYGVTFTAFHRFLNREPIVADLDSDTVARFLCSYQLGRAAPTVNKARSQLLALGRYACMLHNLDTPPDVAKLPEARRIKTFWTPEQLKDLVVAAGGVRGAICGIPAALYWQAMIMVAYSTGLRASAVWSLERDRVNLAAGTVHVLAESQKQKADQVLRITPKTVELVRAIWLPPRTLLFPWCHAAKLRYYYFDKILRAAGLPHGRRDKFHRLRRTTANLGVQYGASQGFDPVKQLGHASDSTTRTFYLADDLGVQAGDVLPDPEL
jgi:integrase